MKGFEYLGSLGAHNPRAISWTWQFAAVVYNPSTILNSPNFQSPFDCKCVKSQNRCSTGKTVIYSSPEAIFWAYFLLRCAREEFCLCITMPAGPFIVRPCSSEARPPHRATGASPSQDDTTNARLRRREVLVMQGRDLVALSLTRSQDNVDE